MRILLAGATGVLGCRLLPLLVADGHEVLGLSRNSTGAATIKSAGGHARVCNVFNLKLLTDVAWDYRPEALIHQLTDLPDDPLLIDNAANARIRKVGTDNLLAAARSVGATRFLAQSVAWSLPGIGGEAVAYLESKVLGAQGVVVRYGRLYGPGTYYPTTVPDSPRIHVDNAAAGTLALIGMDSGVFTLTED